MVLAIVYHVSHLKISMMTIMAAFFIVTGLTWADLGLYLAILFKQVKNSHNFFTQFAKKNGKVCTWVSPG